MEVIFKITISKEYKLQLSTINSEGTETSITEITPCITFDQNTISISDQNEKSIHFLKHWIDHPDDFSTYTVKFQNKSYSLLPEVFFAIIIYDYKKKIEKQFIIKNTILELQINNNKNNTKII